MVWVITMCDRQDIADDDEALFVDRFSNKNGFVVALHEGGIVRVAQEKDDQDDDNDGDNRNTNEDPENPPIIALEPVAAHNKNVGVLPPEIPVKLPEMDPSENEVDADVVITLLTSDYNIDDRFDNKDENTDMSTQHHKMLINPEAVPTTVGNVYNILMRNKTDYVK